jgi:hypothetical protein
MAVGRYWGVHTARASLSARDGQESARQESQRSILALSRQSPDPYAQLTVSSLKRAGGIKVRN